jgi:phage terminase small subunit
MTQNGRRPKPLEQKRRTGRTPGTDSGGRPLPKLSEVSVLPQARETPPYPEELDDQGRQLWDRAWSAAITWLSPDSDLESVKHAAILADEFAFAVAEYHRTHNSKDGMVMVAASKAFTSALADIGFNPTARARLGVAEVKRVSALEDLVNKRASGSG